MNFQDFCAELFRAALNIKGVTAKELDQISYKAALKGGLVGVYGETYTFNSKQFKFFGINFYTKERYGNRLWANIFGTIEGYQACEKNENAKTKEEKKKKYACNKTIFYEHIEPKSITYAKLLKLCGKNPTTNEVKAILDNCKIIVLNKDQKSYCDEKGNNIFTMSDEELLRQWASQGKISNQAFQEALKSIKSKKGNYVNSSDGGTAYARFAHICVCIKNEKGDYKNHFCWREETGDIELFNRYMKDSNHVIPVV